MLQEQVALRLMDIPKCRVRCVQCVSWKMTYTKHSRRFGYCMIKNRASDSTWTCCYGQKVW